MHLKNYNNQLKELLDFGESNVQFFGKRTVMYLINKYLIHMTPTLYWYLINER